MENLKVGQKVRIKSKEWYEACKCLGFKLPEDKTIFDVYHIGQIGNIEKVFGNLVLVRFNDGNSGVFSECWITPIVHQEEQVYKVTEKDLIGDIKYFPIEVVQRMVDCQVEQGNKADISVFQKDNESNRYNKGFNWSKTSEGVEFWNSVIYRGYFDVFFQKYPKQNKVTIQKDMETNKLILNGITLPKDTEAKVLVEDGATIITFEKKEEVKKTKFKDGDIIFLMYHSGMSRIAVFEKKYNEAILIYGCLNLENNETIGEVNSGYVTFEDGIEIIRYATEEEIVKFNKEFEKQKSLKWNAKEFKFEEYMVRVPRGNKYWHITELGTVISSSDYYSPYDNILYKLRNYFKTEKLANQALPKWKEFFKNLKL